ncbi:c-type cytochrome [Gynuella sunshinyii]|uniref:Cytochrome c553 n=1 Tax=Gynuella sunshinyii YC6258 TaxID=1445510 RepID=A0A0C5VV66_9GAMM|nr:cytochrome c [Gynuella sunshinyii]AJQ94289.1 cytochrome c553 [Gynuella sunshinyii YC6258]
MKKLFAAIALSLLVPGMAFAAGDAAAGKEKVTTLGCVACHGADGKSAVGIYPNLAGQQSMYLESSMKAFRSQDRKGNQAALMYVYASKLTDQDIADLAAYFSSLK